MKELNGLQLTTRTIVRLSYSQQALLKLINLHITEKTVLTFDDLVHCYANSVNSEIYYDHHEYDTGKQVITKYHDVIQCYKSQNYVWRQKVKGLVKSWFVSALGILVIKGKLIVLPVMDIAL